MLHLLPEAVRRQAKERPHHPAVIAGGGATLTYAALWDQSLRLADALRARGVRRGDRVAIVMDNVPECAVALFGTWLADAVAVSLNAQIKAEKLEWILRDSGASALISEGHLSPSFTPAAAAVELNVVIATGEGDDLAPGAQSFELLVRGAEPRDPPAQSIPLDLAAILYTSGTSGTPKGVMHTHQSLGFARDSVVAYLDLRGEDRMLCALPLSFGYGLFQLLPATAVGATVLLERNFTYPAEIFPRMRELEATTFAGVPTVFAMLMAHDEKAPLRFPSVRVVTSAAAPLPEDFIEGIQRIFPSAALVKMYGQTECIRASYLPGDLAVKHPGSVGVAIPGTELLLLDEHGNEVGPGETGVLHVRGANVMQGYWRDPDRTAETLVPGPVPGERMLRTGDQFQRDAQGLLHFVARSDEIIKSRGEKVSPTEVENAVYRLSEVSEAMVLGVPDPVLGEAICVVIALKEGASLHPNKVKLACRTRLEGYMVPKHILFVDEIPKNERGKLSRKLASEVFADRLAALQSE